MINPTPKNYSGKYIKVVEKKNTKSEDFLLYHLEGWDK